ncbi:TPA: GlyGly-CTERM sorting domain-containing protein [Vibrio vulnificus]|nr:GlyGly-CTERM sorting domain-containing protein [Vibrio vulnificus]EGR0234414.1 GlyGly-CTERM sorting domain-containing protein [Vibrio vulnificus]HAS8185567.1 GlyGly-CTERM sorting domain-containing protein [Vibrio vulnificus]HAS8373244.1 GlyGly-CTERM sorting domain-containing protein [Vibrio vulnificus]HAS8395262.1 GlyGly-CTERM sorting domain-containing protein [Vibrio vulnificus]
MDKDAYGGDANKIANWVSLLGLLLFWRARRKACE